MSTPQDKLPLPPLYIITPTFRRPEQLAELTRLGYTLKHVPNLLWLVIEDAEHATVLVTKLLEHIGVPFVHLVGEFFRPSPIQYARQPISGPFASTKCPQLLPGIVGGTNFRWDEQN